MFHFLTLFNHHHQKDFGFNYIFVSLRYNGYIDSTYIESVLVFLINTNTNNCFNFKLFSSFIIGYI